MRQNGFTVTWWVLDTKTNETIAICMTKPDADFICEMYKATKGDNYIVRASYTR